MADYLIYDVNDLQAMSSHLSDRCKLMNDIDASATATWNSNGSFYEGFVPISNFRGTFDGQGHTISNLYIQTPTGTTQNDHYGLFGQVSAGSPANAEGIIFKDCILESPTIISNGASIGCFIAYMFLPTDIKISNIRVNNANISASSGVGAMHLAGLIGKWFQSSDSSASGEAYIKQCSVTNSIFTLTEPASTVDVGCMISQLYIEETLTYGTPFEDCYTADNEISYNKTGSNQNTYLGGLFGLILNSSLLTFNRCYTGGLTITGSTPSSHIFVGGCGGTDVSNSIIYINDCFFSDLNVTGTFSSTTIHDDFGLQNGISNASNSYYCDTSYPPIDTDITYSASSNMKGLSIESNEPFNTGAWDFTNIWLKVDGDYPILQDVPEVVVAITNTPLNGPMMGANF